MAPPRRGEWKVTCPCREGALARRTPLPRGGFPISTRPQPIGMRVNGVETPVRPELRGDGGLSERFHDRTPLKKSTIAGGGRTGGNDSPSDCVLLL
jgi:hypothetical protein